MTLRAFASSAEILRPLAALAGTVGPVLFFVVLLVEGAVRPGYRPLLPVATGVMSRAFIADVRWRSLGPATSLTSFMTLALLVGGIAFMSPPGRPSRIGNEYAGLIQRIDVAVFLAWQIAVAQRITRSHSKAN